MNYLIYGQHDIMQVIENYFSSVRSFRNEKENLSYRINDFFHQNIVLVILNNKIDLKLIYDFEKYCVGIQSKDFSCDRKMEYFVLGEE